MPAGKCGNIGLRLAASLVCPSESFVLLILIVVTSRAEVQRCVAYGAMWMQW